MIRKNVLITSGGVATAINVISALRKSKTYDCKIITTDMSENSAGLYLSDKFHITSSAKDKNFLKEIKKIIEDEKIDFIFPLHSSETQLFSDNRSFFKDLNVGISIADKNVVNICNNKDRFEKFLQENNFSYPITYSNKEDVKNYPVFIKLKVGSSSTGAYKVNSLEELNFYIRDKEDKYLIQEYINSKELTVDCYVNENAELVGFVPRYRVKVKDGKSIVAKTMYDENVFVQTKKLLSILKYKGACNVQMFFKDEGIKFIEINPRLSAGGLPLATEVGVNIPELMMYDYFDSVADEMIDYNKNLTMYRYLTEIFV